MRRIREAAVLFAAVAFAAQGVGIQAAKAESRPNTVSTATHPTIKAKGRLTHARRQPAPKIAPAPAPVPAAAAADPVFLSDEWLKQEKQTDDRLRRSMNICKGC